MKKNSLRLYYIITIVLLVSVLFLMFVNFVYVEKNVDGNTLRLTGYHAFHSLMQEGYNSVSPEFGSIFLLNNYDYTHAGNLMFFTTIAFLGLILNLATLAVGAIFANKNVSLASMIASLFSGVMYMLAFHNAIHLDAKTAGSMTTSYAFIPAIVCFLALIPLIIYWVKELRKH